MKTTYRQKIVNDPIYGFITIPSRLVFQLIEHRYFQRLRRISQMGFTNMVYPGANHTRFHHALGAMFLMQKAVHVLQSKKVSISEEEEEALYVAILLHDIGHGPFSHAMENLIVPGISHEDISLFFMHKLNKEFDGKLSLAIQIFKNEYPRKFLHQLVSGQLDMDRLDYLKRDSFYTGVSEGTVNSQRLIAMLYVKDDNLVVEEKGIYSVENFIVARRLMYWQVYLHKTGVAAEQLLIKIFERAKKLLDDGIALQSSVPLRYFMSRSGEGVGFTDKDLEVFSKLDDTDIFAAMKQWETHNDFVLKNLCSKLLDRKLLKVEIQPAPFSDQIIEVMRSEFCEKHKVSKEEAANFIFSGKLVNQAYSMKKDPIGLLRKNGEVIDVAKLSDQLNLEALSNTVVKYYMCYPKIMR